jgi:hypothetical protein
MIVLNLSLESSGSVETFSKGKKAQIEKLAEKTEGWDACMAMVSSSQEVRIAH